MGRHGSSPNACGANPSAAAMGRSEGSPSGPARLKGPMEQRFSTLQSVVSSDKVDLNPEHIQELAVLSEIGVQCDEVISSALEGRRGVDGVPGPQERR